MTTKRVRLLFNFTCITHFLALVLFFFNTSPAGAVITMDGSLGTPGALAGPDYQITSGLGQIRGNNLFQSFGTFSLVSGESATFSGPANIANIIGRVTGGGPSSIDGLIRSTIDGANLFLLNPSGVMFGPNASLDVSGSFHVSTADYLKFSDGSVFYSNPSAGSVLSVAAPEAFGFLSSSPASITLNQSVLQVPPGQTLSIIAGNILLDNNRDSLGTAYYDPTFTVNPLGVGPKYFMLTAPGGTINVISVASPGEVNLGLPDLRISSFARLGSITLSNGANLSVDSDIASSGPAGSIVIRGGDILFSNLGFTDATSQLFAAGIEASGIPAGVVDIKGGSLHLDNAGIGVFTYGADHPGTACRLDLSGNLLMTNGAWIDASNYGEGRCGDISISAGNIILGDENAASSLYADSGFYGYISSTAGGTGQAGNISLAATDFLVRNGFFITTSTVGEGNAGNISLHANAANFLDQGHMDSNAYGSGRGGIVEIVAGDVLISSAHATDVINSSQITGVGARTSGASDGGKIEITADNLQILDGGKISSYLSGAGHGADVEINAKNMVVSGFYADSNLTPKPYALSAVDGRVIGSDATGTGGNITITTDSLKLDNGGVIRTGLYPDQNGGPSGNAGNITVNAGNIDISSRGQIYADSFRGTGNSGDITINAKNLTITGAADVPRPGPLDFDFTGLSTTTNSGHGGTINVSLTGDLTLAAQGAISADTQGTGLGGAVNIAAQNVLLSGQSKISTLSTGAGNAGDINITVANTVDMRESSITTEAVQADGGNVIINALYKVNLLNSEITASVGGGPQTTGGNITIDNPQYVILNKSRIVANAYEGKGGNIKIIANTVLEDPDSIVDASSALGISGTVDIQAAINNVSGIVNPLPSDFVSASALLRERCIARTREGKYSSFVIGGRDGLPIEPGNIMPGFTY